MHFLRDILVKVYELIFDAPEPEGRQHWGYRSVGELQLGVQPCVELLVLPLNGQVDLVLLPLLALAQSLTLIILQLLSLVRYYGQIFQNRIFAVKQNDQ